MPTTPSPCPEYVRAARQGDRAGMVRELPSALRTPEIAAKTIEWAAMWCPLSLSQLVATVPDQVSEHLAVVVYRAVERGNLADLSLLAPLLSQQPEALAERIQTTRDPIALLAAMVKKAFVEKLAGTFTPSGGRKTPVKPVEAFNPAWRRLFQHLAQGHTAPETSAAMGDLLLSWCPPADRAAIVAQGMAWVLAHPYPGTDLPAIHDTLTRWAGNVGVLQVGEVLRSPSFKRKADPSEAVLEAAETLLAGVSSRRLLLQVARDGWGQASEAFDQESLEQEAPRPSGRRPGLS